MLKIFRAATLSVLGVFGTNLSAQAVDPSIFGRHALEQPTIVLSEFPAATAHLLRNDRNGIAAEVELPAGWQTQALAARSYTIELLLLEGKLRWIDGTTERELQRLAYLRMPAAAPWPTLVSEVGARLLVFMDAPQPGDGEQVVSLTTEDHDWQPGVVSKRDTGIALKLEVRDLHHVVETGRRTWLLRAGADLKLPWERHRTIEEGYLLVGDYRLVECINGKEQAYGYRSGGYFFRAPGIIHGGPATGSTQDIVMLLRTPEKLTVEFLPGCSATTEP